MNDQRVLTEEQVEQFNRDGYLLVRGMYSAGEVAEISRWTDGIANSPEVPGRDWKYFEQSREDGERILCRIENFVPFHEGFSALILRRRMFQAVSELFGEDIETFEIDRRLG